MKKLYQLLTSSVAVASTFIALSIPAQALNINFSYAPVTFINTMFQQSRWGGASTTTSMNQIQDLTQYLGQQGLFQVNNGTMWMVSEDLKQVPKPSATVELGQKKRD